MLYDVNDFVPAGAVIVRLRSTEQHAGLAQAQAALSEATAREAEAQTRYQRIADMYQRKVVPKATLDEATANRDAAVARLNAARAALAERAGGRRVYGGSRALRRRRHQAPGAGGRDGQPRHAADERPVAAVPARDGGRAAVDRRSGAAASSKAAVYIGERRIEATKVTIFPEASSPSSTFRARLELPENATDLYPGHVRQGRLRDREGGAAAGAGDGRRRAQRGHRGLRRRSERARLDAPGAARRSLRRAHRDPLGSGGRRARRDSIRSRPAMDCAPARRPPNVRPGSSSP